MKRTKFSKVSRPSIDSTNSPAANDGVWVIEMRPSASRRPTAERSTSRAPSSHDLFEQTFHYLRGFLDRLYR